jgi:LysR family transcriptional activator of nhaA
VFRTAGLVIIACICFAEEIFGLGQELLDMLKGRPTGHPSRLRVGVVDVVPKLVARRLLEPCLSLEQPT